MGGQEQGRGRDFVHGQTVEDFFAQLVAAIWHETAVVHGGWRQQGDGV